MTYFKVMCESLSAGDLDHALCVTVRSHGGGDWDTSRAGIPELRLDLLRRQNFRCAYCQTHISGDVNGLRELDHILPKNRTRWLDPGKAIQSTIEARTHTLGYRKFTFEPLNLVIACKQCNTNKGQFDPLEVRGLLAPEHYPMFSGAFRWVHPYFDRYSDNIEITARRLYVQHSEKGRAVIKACKLDKAETLSRSRAAEAFCADHHNFVDALDGFSSPSRPFHREEILDALETRFSWIPRVRAAEALDALRAAKFNGFVNIANAFQLASNLQAEYPEPSADVEVEEQQDAR